MLLKWLICLILALPAVADAAFVRLHVVNKSSKRIIIAIADYHSSLLSSSWNISGWHSIEPNDNYYFDVQQQARLAFIAYGKSGKAFVPAPPVHAHGSGWFGEEDTRNSSFVYERVYACAGGLSGFQWNMEQLSKNPNDKCGEGRWLLPFNILFQPTLAQMDDHEDIYLELKIDDQIAAW